MKRSIALIATVAIFGIAACGNDSPTSATTPGTDAAVATTPVENTVVENTVVDETVTEETGTTVAGGANGAGTEFCDINQELNDTPIPVDGTATPDDVEAYFTEFFPERLALLEGSVPPELAGDVETLIDGVLQFGAVLEANDWVVEAAFADPALEAIATNPDFEAAGARVDAYCGA